MRIQVASVMMIWLPVLLVFGSVPGMSSAQDIEQEHEQLVCKAILKQDHKKLKSLLQTPYVTVESTCAYNTVRARFLHKAAGMQMPMAVQILLKEGADPNVLDKAYTHAKSVDFQEYGTRRVQKHGTPGRRPLP